MIGKIKADNKEVYCNVEMRFKPNVLIDIVNNSMPTYEDEKPFSFDFPDEEMHCVNVDNIRKNFLDCIDISDRKGYDLYHNLMIAFERWNIEKDKDGFGSYTLTQKRNPKRQIHLDLMLSDEYINAICNKAIWTIESSLKSYFPDDEGTIVLDMKNDKTAERYKVRIPVNKSTDKTWLLKVLKCFRYNENGERFGPFGHVTVENGWGSKFDCEKLLNADGVLVPIKDANVPNGSYFCGLSIENKYMTRDYAHDKKDETWLFGGTFEFMMEDLEGHFCTVYQMYMNGMIKTKSFVKYMEIYNYKDASSDGLLRKDENGNLLKDREHAIELNLHTSLPPFLGHDREDDLCL